MKIGGILPDLRAAMGKRIETVRGRTGATLRRKRQIRPNTITIRSRKVLQPRDFDFAALKTDCLICSDLQ